MGLDIVMRVTGNEVLSEMGLGKEWSRFHDLWPRFEEFGDQRISTRPGSYRGLHLVRNVWAKAKGYSDDYRADEASRIGIDHPCRASHLCWHSDCEGWYVPEIFDPPIMSGDVSIGSSVRLLEELESIRSLGMVEDVRAAYEAVLIPAVASVVTNQPIKFS